MILKIWVKTEGSKTNLVIASTGQHSTRAGTAAIPILLQQLLRAQAALTHLGNICHQNCRPSHFKLQTTAGQHHDARGLEQFSTILDIQPLRTQGATPYYLKASWGAQSGPGLPCQDHITVHFCHKTMAGMHFLKQTFNWPTAGDHFLALTDPGTNPWWEGFGLNLLQCYQIYPLTPHTWFSQLMSRDWQVPGTPTI